MRRSRATADREGRVNVSSKVMGRLRIHDDTKIQWLILSGSGHRVRGNWGPVTTVWGQKVYGTIDA